MQDKHADLLETCDGSVTWQIPRALPHIKWAYETHWTGDDYGMSETCSSYNTIRDWGTVQYFNTSLDLVVASF